MKNTVSTGMNRTGMGTSPIDGSLVIEGANQSSPIPPGTSADIHRVNQAYSKNGQIGTVPTPATAKGMFTVAKEMLKGSKPSVFIDKLGERLAFERTGTRLYESVLAKFDVLGTWAGGPSREELLMIRDEELQHFAMLAGVIAQLGADPTAMTPCADVTAVESLGLLQVVNDPRATLPQALHSALIAELADTAGWDLLSSLATELGHVNLAAKFTEANQTEMKHLGMVRTWLTTQVIDEATRELKQQPAE